LTFNLFSPILSHMTRRSCWTYEPIFKFIALVFLKYAAINCRFRGPVARQPSLPWQPVCAPLVEGSSTCQPPTMKLTGPPATELLQFLTVSLYVTWPCDLELWPLDLGFMSRDATWVLNTCAKFEMYITYWSRVMTITIFHCPPGKSPNFHVFVGKGGNFNFHLSNPQKALPRRERRIMTYWAWVCVQKCDLSHICWRD